MMNRAEISALILSVMGDKSDGDWITRFMKKLTEKNPELYDYMLISCKVKQEEMEKKNTWLTDEEIDDCFQNRGSDKFKEIAAAIRAKLREKNGG